MHTDTRRKWNATASYSLMHSAAWGFYAIILIFSSNVLYERGFSDSAISLFLGVSTGLSVVTQLAITEYISRHPEGKVYRLMVLFGVIMLLCAVLLGIPGTNSRISIAVFAVSCLVLQMLPSFTNAMGMDTIKRGAPTNYSLARGIGSLAYSLLAVMTGVLVRRIGTQSVPMISGVMAVILIVSSVWYHHAADRDLTEPAETEIGKKKDSFLRKYPGFACFLLGTIFLTVSHSLLANFMYQIMLSKNGGAAEQGISTSVSGLVELPVMFFFPLLMKKLRCENWVRIAAVSMILKPFGVLLATAPFGIYMAQATQMIGYGLLVISSVNYAERIVTQGESVRAQSYLGAAATVSTLTALSVGGVIIEYFGTETMVRISFMCSVIGCLIVLFSTRKGKS